mgnify:CR=1 FL=1
MIKSIYHDTKLTVLAVKVDADNETITGAGVDMSGFEGVAFVAVIGKGEVVTHSLKAQQDADSAFGTAADLAGTATAFATAVAADGMAVLDIYQPQERYVRPVLTVGNFGTARPAMILAIQYGAKVMPQSNVGEFHQSPAEGTA